MTEIFFSQMSDNYESPGEKLFRNLTRILDIEVPDGGTYEVVGEINEMLDRVPDGTLKEYSKDA